MMKWTNGMLGIAGLELEYACYGPNPDTAPTLVLLHEGLGSASLWRDWPRDLAEATGLGVLVYSRAGYGRSSPVRLPRPLDYMTREAEDVLGAILDATGVQRTVLVGHSDGATIAAIYAGSIQDHRVRGLVLIAPHFFPEAHGMRAIRTARETYETGTLREKLARHHDSPDVAFYGWYNAWTHPDFADWNVADCIDHWRIPVLAIQGHADPYGTMAQINEIESRIYAPFEKLVLSECGHAPHVDQPRAVTAAVASFCETLFRLEDLASPLN